MDSVTAFAPATVSNVACGFDVLGFALEAPGDEVTARWRESSAAEVTIDDIVGDEGRLPRAAERNTAGVAARALLTRLGERRGVALTIRKGLPLASGLGGSAASAVAAVVAVNALAGASTPLEALKASASARAPRTATISRRPCTAASCWCVSRTRPMSFDCPHRPA